MSDKEHIKQLQKLLADQKAETARVMAERDELQKRLCQIAEDALEPLTRRKPKNALPNVIKCSFCGGGRYEGESCRGCGGQNRHKWLEGCRRIDGSTL
jgi:hypothetical protein